MPKKPAPPSFVSTLSELEAIAARLEGNNIPLEQSIVDFEHGIQLIRRAQNALQQAEQKVQILQGRNDNVAATSTTDRREKESD